MPRRTKTKCVKPSVIRRPQLEGEPAEIDSPAPPTFKEYLEETYAGVAKVDTTIFDSALVQPGSHTDVLLTAKARVIPLVRAGRAVDTQDAFGEKDGFSLEDLAKVLHKCEQQALPIETHCRENLPEEYAAIRAVYNDSDSLEDMGQAALEEKLTSVFNNPAYYASQVLDRCSVIRLIDKALADPQSELYQQYADCMHMLILHAFQLGKAYTTMCHLPIVKPRLKRATQIHQGPTAEVRIAHSAQYAAERAEAACTILALAKTEWEPAWSKDENYKAIALKAGELLGRKVAWIRVRNVIRAKQ